MDDLKQFFLSALSTRTEALETAATTMDADPVGALATIRRLAHSLRGSGTTYGYPEITEAAMRVEEAEPEEVPPLLRELVRTMKGVVAEANRAAAAEKSAARAAQLDPAAPAEAPGGTSAGHAPGKAAPES